MSRTVDSRAVEMQFDNSNFEANVKQSISTLDKLKRALKLDGASAGLQEVEKASSRLNFRDLNGNIDDVGRKFGILETIATGALLKIGATAADAGMRIAKSLTVDQVAAGWDKYAEKTTSVQTIMANLRDTEGDFVNDAAKLDYVNKYLNKLLWFSDETSYSFTDMTSNVGKFIANGQGLKESVTAMQGIATWAAVSGQNSQTASRVMYNISQALGTGAMKIKDWMSVENANMATAQFKELAITIGQKQGKIKEGQVTIENFRESLGGKDTRDWFDKDVMMEVFQTYGEAANRIQEYAEAHDVTSTEAIRKIKETDKEFADSIGFKAFAAAQEAKTFSEVVSATADAVSTKWMRIFENVFGNYLEAKEMWTDLSEQMWEIFASPLDTLNEIMTAWNSGFFIGGAAPGRWFSLMGNGLQKVEGRFRLVSKSEAETKVASDALHYSIRKLKDGTEELVYAETNAAGQYAEVTRKILDEDSLSGRTMLIEAFQNIFDTLVHDVEDENGKLESMSFFGSLKRGLQEVIFGTSEVDEIVPKVSRKLWDLTKRFKDLTERLKPSMETSLKLKNAFKGLFSLFKIGGKFVGAIFKPFKELFGRVFKNAPKTVLDLADSIGTWVQKLDSFLEENEVFGKVSKKIGSGLETITNGIDKLVTSITGKSLADLGAELKTKIFGFFEDYDFQAKVDSVSNFYNDVVEQIRQVKSGELPEELTPFQKFLVVAKKVFTALTNFFDFIAPIFKNTWAELKTAIETKDFGAFFGSLKEIFTSITSQFGDTGSISKIFAGIGSVISSIAGFLSNLTDNTGVYGLLKTAGSIGIIGLLVSFINNFIAVWLIGRKVDWFMDSIYETFMSIQRFFNAKAFEATANGAKALGVALLLMAAAIHILGNMDIGVLTKGLVAIALLLGVFWAFKTLAKDVNTFNLLGSAVSFGLLAVVFGLLGLITFALGSMDPRKLYQGLTAILILTLIFGLFKKLQGERKLIDMFNSVTDMLVSFAAGMFVLAVAVAILGSLSVSSLAKGLGAITVLVLIFTLFAKLSEKMSQADILKATGGLALFAIAVDILAIGVKALGGLDPVGLTGAVVAIALLTLIFAMFAKLTAGDKTKSLKKAAKAFAQFAIAVDILAIGVKTLSGLDPVGLTGAVVAIALLTLIFAMFGKLAGGEHTKGVKKAAKAFAQFAIAVDIISIGVKNLGSLDTGDLIKGIAAVAAMVLLFGLLKAISGKGGINPGSTKGFLVFSLAVLAICVSLNELIPVMQQIDAMGDGWWKPLVFLAAAIALIVAAGAISGIGPVTVGLLALSVAMLAIGTACLFVGIGIGIAAAGLALLAMTIAKYGTETADNIGTFIDTILSVIISSVPKMAQASAALIIALALGLGMSAGALVAAGVIVILAFISATIQALVAAIPLLVTGLVQAINAMAAAIRFSAPMLTSAMMGLLESLVEAVLVGIATIVEPWGGVGAAISDKIMKWIPGLREAFGVVSDEAAAAGADTESAYEDAFSGDGGGHAFGGESSDSSLDVDAIMSKIPGIPEGSLDFSNFISADSFDMTSLQSILGDSFGQIDFTTLMDGKMGELTTSIEDSTPDVSTAAQSAADAIEEPITSLDAYTWGTDIGNNLSSGLRSVIPTVETTASDMAAAIAKYVHFSEPDEGPLSNFHTFAPDMIKLWCKGVRDNIGQVESSGETMADAVYDGFSTALDYVSDLIDNGMSDQLTIRPVMDLSEIQNGVDSMYGMMSSANGYEITGTTRLAASSAYGMRGVNDVPQTTTQTIQSDSGSISNTFYITNGDPNAVAEKVSKILSQQTRRQKAIFAK